MDSTRTRDDDDSPGLVSRHLRDAVPETLDLRLRLRNALEDRVEATGARLLVADTSRGRARPGGAPPGPLVDFVGMGERACAAPVATRTEAAMKLSYRSVQTVEKTTSVDLIPVGDDLFAFMVKRHTVVTANEGDIYAPAARTSTSQGIADRNSVKAMLAGSVFAGRKDLYLADADFREKVRTTPFFALRPAPALRSDFHDALSSGERNAADLVRYDSGCQLFYDMNDRPLPTAVYFGGTSGSITPRFYDLRKLAAHLVGRSDVAVYGRPSLASSSYDLDVVTKDVNQALHPPRSWEGSTSTIHFAWQPSPTDAKAMWDWCRDNVKSKGRLTDDRHRAIFALDLLGARAAGCANYDDYDPPYDVVVDCNADEDDPSPSAARL